MDACFFNNFFWQLLSILALTFFGIFWTFEHVMVQKFPMTKLLALAMAIAAAFVVWVKIELRVPPYHLDAVVDLILAVAMVIIVIHVLMLLLKASLISVPPFVEKWLIAFALTASCIFGVYLFAVGTTAQFLELSVTVNYLLRSFWVVAIFAVLMRLFVRTRA